uniref:Uncharacterized protein n=1 Tax=Neolamprologus brichardi TaxID=32507 RepID=A0A3Q4MZH0_NEOBR
PQEAPLPRGLLLRPIFAVVTVLLPVTDLFSATSLGALFFDGDLDSPW